MYKRQGQTITQQNNPSDGNINTATAIVENITKFREGTVEIIEVEINPETTVGTFVSGQTLTGTSNINDEVTVKITTSQALSDTTITNDGSTLTVSDEATLVGGAGAGARVQVLDIQEADLTTEQGVNLNTQITSQLRSSLSQDLIESYLTGIQERAEITLNQQAISAVHANFQ
mgnify:CR=1 FL=1